MSRVRGSSPASGSQATYAVHARVGGIRITVRRALRSLEEAVDDAEVYRTGLSYRAEDLVIVVEGTRQVLSLLEAKRTLSAQQLAGPCGRRFGEARRSAARATERASLARERAILAFERARTLFADRPGALAGAPVDADWLIALADRAATRMGQAILSMEQELARDRGL